MAAAAVENLRCCCLMWFLSTLTTSPPSTPCVLLTTASDDDESSLSFDGDAGDGGCDGVVMVGDDAREVLGDGVVGFNKAWMDVGGCFMLVVVVLVAVRGEDAFDSIISGADDDDE